MLSYVKELLTRREKQDFILLVPPGMLVQIEVKQYMKMNGFTKFEELEERAGCRVFRCS